MGVRNIHHTKSSRHRLAGGVIVALGLTASVVASAWRDNSTLGAPRLWPWLLTGLQVLSLWSAGRGLWWAWLLGGAVQLPWIAYALMTSQIGFIPGCAISASVQFYSFLRSAAPSNPPSRRPMEAPT